VVGGTVFLALMLAYRSRPVFVPAARPNDPIAPYRTQVMRRSGLFGWGVAVAVGVLCGLIAQSGCSAVRALSAPNWYAPDSQGRFARVVDHPRPQVQLRRKTQPHARWVARMRKRLEPIGAGKSSPLRRPSEGQAMNEGTHSTNDNGANQAAMTDELCAGGPVAVVGSNPKGERGAPAKRTVRIPNIRRGCRVPVAA
jgi:hypothetical protein